MATTSKNELFASLRAGIRAHREILRERFAPETAERLSARPAAGEWSALECLDHLVSTHDYYAPLLDAAERDVTPAAEQDVYTPSFFGGIYLWFQRPRFRFPAPSELAPRGDLDPDVLQAYAARLDALEARLRGFESADLRATRIPLKMGVRFNLGDVLRFLVVHDELHLDQAKRALDAQGRAGG